MAASAITFLCRDCLATATGEVKTRRCPHCASPRLITHAELGTLAIAHIDCDAFYAAVEKRDSPELRDRPVIVGGGRRGVVSTCCYIARIDGVRSAMPMFKALKLCPKAVVIPPNMEKYARVGREIRTMMQALTPLVEPLSIDEAFLDLNGTERLHGMAPARLLAGFALEIEQKIGITISIGLSHNKFLAKIASDLEKPKGFSVIGRAETLAFLEPKPVSMIWGVGKALQQTLHGDGIRTIAELRRHSEADLIRRHGVMGQRLYRLARGEDHRSVSAADDTKSVSVETTFDTDISDRRLLEKHLWHLTEKLARRLKKAGLCGLAVTLKLKTADFKSRTRSHTLDDPTALAARLHDVGKHLLVRECDGTAFRLIGIGVSHLKPLAEADPATLVNQSTQRAGRIEKAVDALRGKFGDRAVIKGIVFDDK